MPFVLHVKCNMEGVVRGELFHSPPNPHTFSYYTMLKILIDYDMLSGDDQSGTYHLKNTTQSEPF